MIKKKSSSAMIKKFYLYSVFNTALFHVPILVIFLQNTLNDPLQVGFLLTVKTITTLVCEIPTGFISDHISRKLSILIGLLLNCASLIIFVTQTNFIFFVIAQIIFGLSETFSSGSDSAWLYDNLKGSGELERFESTLKNISFFGSLMLFITFILGSYFYQISHVIPFILTAICIIISFFVCFTIKEYNYKDGLEYSDKKSIFNFHKILKEPKIVWFYVLFPNIIEAILYSFYLYVIPIWLSKVQISEKYFGLIFSIGVLFFGLGSKFSGFIKNNHSFLNWKGPFCVMIIFIGSSFSNISITAIIFLIFIRIIWGAYTTIYSIEINRLIKDSVVRSSVLSIGSALQSGISSIFILLYSLLIETISLNKLLWLSGGMLIIFGLVFYFISKRENLLTIDT